jgi:hypothetical protein
MVEHDKAASVGRLARNAPEGRCQSQFRNSLLAGNPNRSFSEFDSCLPDLVLQVYAAAAQ